MGMLVGEQFRLRREEVLDLTNREIAEWYIIPALRQQKKALNEPADEIEAVEQQAVAAALAWGGDAEEARRNVRAAMVKQERDRRFAALEREG